MLSREGASQRSFFGAAARCRKKVVTFLKGGEIGRNKGKTHHSDCKKPNNPLFPNFIEFKRCA